MPHKDLILERSYKGYLSAKAKVYVKPRWEGNPWTDSWTGPTYYDDDPGAVTEDLSFLHAREVHFRSAASGMSTAVLTWRYGKALRPIPPRPPDTPQPTPHESAKEVNRIDLTGYYVRIAITPAIDSEDPFAELKEESEYWHGVVVNVTDMQLGSLPGGVINGRQEFMCVGLEWFLNVSNIQNSYWTKNDLIEEDFELEFLQGPVLIPFNEEGKANRSSDRLGNPKSYIFIPKHDNLGPGFSPPWSSRDIVEYLLRRNPPIGYDAGAGQETQFLEFDVSDADLENIPSLDRPEVEQRGRTHWDILRSLMPPQRSMDFRVELEPPEDPEDPEDPETWDPGIIKIVPFTHTDIPFNLSGDLASVPVNDNTVHFDLTKFPAGSVTLRRDSMHQVDQVIGKGDFRTTVMTFGTTQAGVGSAVRVLVADWTSLEKASYDLGDSDNTDFPSELEDQRRWVTDHRNNDLLAHVYSRFRVPEEFAQTASDNTRPYSVKILRTTYLHEGADYSVADLDDLNVDETRPTRDIFGVIRVPDQEKYVYLHRVSKESFIEETNFKAPNKWSASIRVERWEPKFRIEVNGEQPQHVLAAEASSIESEKFNPIPIVDDEPNLGEWDLGTINVTMAVESDVPLEARYPVELPTKDIVRTLEIDFGEAYKLIQIEQGTLVSLQANDQTLTDFNVRSTKHPIVLRNDTGALLEKVKTAYSYYSRPRGVLSISIPLVDGVQDLRVGDYVQTLAIGLQDPEKILEPEYNNSDEVNSVITKKSYFFPIVESESPQSDVGPAQVQIETSLGELDFGQ